ncbi:hypothetical protein F4782DRAFT_530642 [Xylaria castorea]|nr:hypothetical protein F4782DRAFT_530642 [Xylaria castorea]
MQNGNRPPAETVPLLGPPTTNPASSNKVASHGSGEGAWAGTSNVKNGLPQVEAAANETSDELPKPTVKMAILIPALSICPHYATALSGKVISILPYGWYIGWRCQCPIALLALIAVYLVLNSPQTDHLHWSAKILRIEFIGAYMLSWAVFLLVFGLNNGSNEGWRKKITVVPRALAPALFAIFVLVEVEVVKEPFAPSHVIFDTPLLVTSGASFFGFAGQMGVYFSISLFYQAALDIAFRS